MNWKRTEAVMNSIEDQYLCEAAEYAGLYRRESCSGSLRPSAGNSPCDERARHGKPRGVRGAVRAAGSLRRPHLRQCLYQRL